MKKAVTTPKTVERIVEKVVENTTEIVDVEGGFITLLDTEVYVQCTSYAYTGKLSGVNHTFIELSEPSLVYETGSWTDKKWKNAERLPCEKIVLLVSQIESAFTVKR